MKKIVSFTLAVITAGLIFCGCGVEKEDRDSFIQGYVAGGVEASFHREKMDLIFEAIESGNIKNIDEYAEIASFMEKRCGTSVYLTKEEVYLYIIEYLLVKGELTVNSAGSPFELGLACGYAVVLTRICLPDWKLENIPIIVDLKDKYPAYYKILKEEVYR